MPGFARFAKKKAADGSKAKSLDSAPKNSQDNPNSSIDPHLINRNSRIGKNLGQNDDFFSEFRDGNEFFYDERGNFSTDSTSVLSDGFDDASFGDTGSVFGSSVTGSITSSWTSIESSKKSVSKDEGVSGFSQFARRNKTNADSNDSAGARITGESSSSAMTANTGTHLELNSKHKETSENHKRSFPEKLEKRIQSNPENSLAHGNSTSQSFAAQNFQVPHPTSVHATSNLPMASNHNPKPFTDGLQNGSPRVSIQNASMSQIPAYAGQVLPQSKEQRKPACKENEQLDDPQRQGEDNCTNNRKIQLPPIEPANKSTTIQNRESESGSSDKLSTRSMARSNDKSRNAMFREAPSKVHVESSPSNMRNENAINFQEVSKTPQRTSMDLHPTGSTSTRKRVSFASTTVTPNHDPKRDTTKDSATKRVDGMIPSERSRETVIRNSEPQTVTPLLQSFKNQSNQTLQGSPSNETVIDSKESPSPMTLFTGQEDSSAHRFPSNSNVRQKCDLNLTAQGKQKDFKRNASLPYNDEPSDHNFPSETNNEDGFEYRQARFLADIRETTDIQEEIEADLRQANDRFAEHYALVLRDLDSAIDLLDTLEKIDEMADRILERYGQNTN